MARSGGMPAILLVDDDYDIREVLSEILVDAGYSVMGAADGAEALSMLQAGPALPCVILLDLMMPVMTGWEFRLAQQRDPRLAPIPVIVLSARQDVAHEAYTIAVNAFMHKPVDLDELLSAVAGYCAP